MRHNKSSAWTLIEVLISASIAAVIIAGVYSAFQAGLVSYRRIDAAFLPYQAARNIFNRLELDLRNSFAYTAGDSGFQAGRQNLDFYSVLDSFKEGEEIRDFCRVKYEADVGLLRRLVYAGQEAVRPNGTARTESAYKIKEISFQYAVSTGAQKEIEWQDTWPGDASRKDRLPLAVKIKLFLEVSTAGRQEALEFDKLIALPMGA